MPIKKTIIASLCIMTLTFAYAKEPVKDSKQHADFKAGDFTVYKNAQCHCCDKWVTHVQQQGFTATVNIPEDLSAIKTAYGIKPQYQSCHTAVSGQGYVFEGHIPAWVIQAFLDEKPDEAAGLTVPGMPLGSPGMESTQGFTPYRVWVRYKNGTQAIYRTIDSQVIKP